VWNPGEKPVEGYTTFLWAAIHAPFIAAGISPLLVSKIISAFSGIILIIFVLSPFNLVIQTGIWRIALAIMVAICPALLFYCQSGMETFFFMTLILLGTFLWISSRLSENRLRYVVGASIILGIAALTRPEGLLVFGTTWLIDLCQTRRRGLLSGRWWHGLVQYSLPFLVIWAPYFLWRFHYYGYFFPNTYYAKYSGNRLRNLPLGFLYIGKAFTSYLVMPLAFMIGMASSTSVNADGRLREISSIRKIIFPLSILASVYIFYVLWMGGDDTSAFPSVRLIVPVLPIIWLALFTFCEATVKGTSRLRQALLATALLALSLFAWTSDGFMLLKDANPGLRSVNTVRANLELIYGKARHLGDESPGELALWVHKVTDSKALIAVPFAGRIPYYADRPAIDTLGLNDVHIAHMAPLQGGFDVKMDPEYVLSRHPILIVVNVKRCYWYQQCSFTEAGGWKLGDEHFLELLRNRSDYSLVDRVPGSICVFEYHPQP
jgi:hypothetical protein